MAYFKYKQVADQLLEKIQDGTYKPGDKIPKEDELCTAYGVGRQTLRNAVSQLEESGYLKRIQGSGTYVCEPAGMKPEDSLMDQIGTMPAGNPGVIALVMMNSENYIFLDLMRGVSDYLMEQGYVLTTMMTDGDYERERIALENLLQNPPAGILLEPVWPRVLSVNESLLRQISETIPCLLLHSDQTEMFPAYPLRDREAMCKLTNYLISLGHRRIGTLFSFDESTGQNRYLGCMQALRENGIVQTRDRMVWFEHSRAGDLFEPDGQIGLNRMLADVTAVVCHDDRIAYRLINYLQSKGIRVPEDISVTGYDDSAYATMDLPLTTVQYQGNKYGRNAAKTLLQMIRQPDFDFSGLHADEPELVIRASTTVPRNEKNLSVM